jgi:NADPH-dependent curcumin reductase CurA
MTTVNRSISLASRPVGFPRVSDFNLSYSQMPSPHAGEVLVRSLYLSLDPSLRERMDDGEPSTQPLAIGEVLVGKAVASVLESRDPRFEPGDVVLAKVGWQEYGVAQGNDLTKLHPNSAPMSTALGVLGMPGLTAYFGVLDVCSVRPGETVVVSGAAGAVGMVAGQLARIEGCRVVGVAGADAETAWLLDELGFDAAVNYQAANGWEDRLRELCPAGVDAYFDTVGGMITDAVIRLVNSGARIAVCGQTSQYNLERPETGPRWLRQLVAKQATLRGFLISSFAERFPEGLERLHGWLKEGKLKYREEIVDGIEAAPQAFISMLHGRGQGKQLVRM